MDAQVKVSQVGLVGTVYQVEGNAKDGTLTYTIAGDSPVTVLEWVDGLIITEGEMNDIPIPAEVDGLPTGSVGEMLYHNGTDWVVLANPAAPGSGSRWVMHHDGTAPEFLLYEEIDVSICIAGTPATYKILGNLVP